MTTDHEIRKIIFQNPHTVRWLMLTDPQVNIIIRAREYGVITSRDIADFFNISIQNASTQLSKLCSRGYLRKGARVAKTGGFEYLYRSVL